MSFHERRFTAQKIAQRLGLIEALVYRRKEALAPFRFKQLEHPLQHPTAELVADVEQWPAIPARTYWGEPNETLLPIEDQTIFYLDLKPFQIVTVRLVFA